MGNPPYDPNYSQQPPDPYGQGQVTFQQYQPEQGQQYYQQQPPPEPEKSNAGLVIAIVAVVIAVVVVLAVVLYVMVIGIGGGSPSTPAGSWNSLSPESQTTAKAVFGAFTVDVAPLDLRIFVNVNGVSAGSITIPSNTGAAPQTCNWVGRPAGAGCTYFDYNPAGGTVNSGDYLSFTGLQPGTVYTLVVFHIPSESTVSMTGASGQFTTP